MSLTAIRPLSLGEVLDGAFSLYRRHFSTFAATSLLASLPVIVCWAFVGAATTPGSMGIGVLLIWVARIFATVMAAGALTQQASAAYLGNEVTVGAGMALARNRFFTLWGTLIVQGLIVGVGFLLLIMPGFIFLAMFFAMVPAVVVEGKNSSTSQARSRELAQGALAPLIGGMVVIGIITWIPVLAVAMLAGAISGVAGLDGNTALAAPQVLTTAAQALAVPFQFIATILLYYDRRVRTEALDLEFPAESAEAAAPPAFA